MSPEVEMEDQRETGGGGCASRLVIAVALVWFGLVHVVSNAVVGGAADGWVGARALSGISILVAGVASTVPFAVLALLVRRRPGGKDVAAAASSLAAASGYVILDAALRLVLPSRQFLVPLRSRYLVALLRLVLLLPYSALAARLAPRMAGASQRPVLAWLGLKRSQGPTALLSLTAAALVTLPWPVTGALGDSLDSLATTAQVLASVIPQLLIFWGVIFVLLTATFARTEGAAVTAILIYALSALGGRLSRGQSGTLMDVLSLLPLGFLMAELRARGGGVLSLISVALCYRLAPLLFVDPRDVVALGIPELQHVISYRVVGLTAAGLTVALWVGRRIWQARGGGQSEEGGRRGSLSRTLAALAAAVTWGLWAGLYVFAGEPGFFNHGFLIILEEQAGLEGVRRPVGREARLSAVRDALIETAERSQDSMRKELDGLNVPYRRYYIMNMVRVDGHRWLMDRFVARPGVSDVILNPNVRRYPYRIPFPYGDAEDVEGVQGNLAAIGADAAWEMDVLGRTIVVGGQDTGYDWDHPALKAQYRGWDGERVDHNYNWHDAWDDVREPFDDGFHGTHTMGTVLGDDGSGNRTGVAPEATWIGCRNMRRGFGNPGSYAECMEFLLAPYPLGGDAFRDGDVRMAADVTNNSWGCPRWEGCFPQTLEPAVDAMREAGVMMVVSAGNDGPACNTAATPPARYDAAFTVGATTDGGDIVGFSSRGPVRDQIKPDIAAPGRRVRSSVPGGGYGTLDGTSMAGPHVAGVVALIWSADQRLIGDIDATEELLCRTAEPQPVSQSCEDVSVPEGPLAAAGAPPPCACGGVLGVPNNVYGCGVVNAGAAVESLLGD